MAILLPSPPGPDAGATTPAALGAPSYLQTPAAEGAGLPWLMANGILPHPIDSHGFPGWPNPHPTGYPISHVGGSAPSLPPHNPHAIQHASEQALQRQAVLAAIVGRWGQQQRPVHPVHPGNIRGIAQQIMAQHVRQQAEASALARHRAAVLAALHQHAPWHQQAEAAMAQTAPGAVGAPPQMV